MSESVRMHGDGLSHPFYVWSGLLEPKHVKKIGPRLWVLLWCIRRTTREKGEGKDRLGYVLGGKPVLYREIAADLGFKERTVRRHVDQLVFAGYIDTTQTPRGLCIRVLNSCRFKKGMARRVLAEARASNADASLPRLATHSDKIGQSEAPLRDNDGQSHDKNGHSNIRESSKRKQSEEKAVEKTPAEPLKTASHADVCDPIFWKGLAKAKSLPQELSPRDLDERRRLLLDQAEQNQPLPVRKTKRVWDSPEQRAEAYAALEADVREKREKRFQPEQQLEASA
jgi:hypothetical protein